MKNIDEIKDEEIDSEINERRSLMVGMLYPSILTNEIIQLLERRERLRDQCFGTFSGIC